MSDEALPQTPPEAPSLQVRVGGLEVRVDKLETQSADVVKKLDALTVKTDTQTMILSRLDKVAANPIARAIFIALGFAVAAWLTRHGIKVEIPQ